MKKFNRKQLINCFNATPEEIEIVMKYQRQLPILLEVEASEDLTKGFVVDARKLYNQLNKIKKRENDKEFSHWIKRKIENSKGEVRFIENIDYSTFDKFAERENSNLKSKSKEYKITLDMAKQLCMMENNSIGFDTRRYFILMEEFCKRALEWQVERDKTKADYEPVKSAFTKYMMKVKGVPYYKMRNFYPYLFDYINVLATGMTAKENNDKRHVMDKQTRDNFDTELNQRVAYVQDVMIDAMEIGLGSLEIENLALSKIERKFGVNHGELLEIKMKKYNYLFR